ncbi:MAG: YdcF family protein [bacterium]
MHKKKILVVLGGLVVPLNKLHPCDTLLRCEEAIKIWEGHNQIIVTGGIFLPKEVQTKPVADLMKEWLIKNGVPAEKILTVTDAVDTFQEIEGVVEKIGGKKASINVLSHWQHLIRSFITFLFAHGILIKPYPIFYWKGGKDFIREWGYCFLHIVDPSGRWVSKKNRERRKKAASK